MRYAESSKKNSQENEATRSAIDEHKEEEEEEEVNRYQRKCMSSRWRDCDIHNTFQIFKSHGPNIIL